MMRGLQQRLAQIKSRLVADHAGGLLAMEEIVTSLDEQGREPFPGFAENMTAEFTSIRAELAALDPNQPSNARRFVAIAKRINFLSRTVSYVVEHWLKSLETDASPTSRGKGGTGP